MRNTNWSTTVGQGSTATWQFAFQNADGTPYNISGFTWEYVIRSERGTRVDIPITTTPSANGVLTVTTGAQSLVTLLLRPVATAALPGGPYIHALWSNPGSTDAFCWFTGGLVVQALPQP